MISDTNQTPAALHLNLVYQRILGLLPMLDNRYSSVGFINLQTTVLMSMKFVFVYVVFQPIAIDV